MSGEDGGSGAASVARCMDIGCLVLFAVGGIVMFAGNDAGTIGKS